MTGTVRTYLGEIVRENGVNREACLRHAVPLTGEYTRLLGLAQPDGSFYLAQQFQPPFRRSNVERLIA